MAPDEDAAEAPRGQLWHGRFDTAPAEELVAFTESLSYDQRLLVDDVRCSKAHVRGLHRVGLLAPGDQIVMVAVTSAHRGQSYQACEFLMDYLKTQAPFWKKERTPQGEQWVDARVSDDAAAARWGLPRGNA